MDAELIPCTVLAFWFSDGITQSDIDISFSLFDDSHPIYTVTMPPSWIIVVHKSSLSANELLWRKLNSLKHNKVVDQPFTCLRLGVMCGNLLISKESHNSISHPFGSAMSGAMKRATKASEEEPVIGLEDIK